MTPGPWTELLAHDQAAFFGPDGNYVAILVTQVETVKGAGAFWKMEPENREIMLASPLLLRNLTKSTVALNRLRTRFPKDVSLDIYITMNEQLLATLPRLPGEEG